jgi:hypothetical protein
MGWERAAKGKSRNWESRKQKLGNLEFIYKQSKALKTKVEIGKAERGS